MPPRMRVWIAALVLVVAAGCGGLFADRTEGEKLWRKHCADCHGLDAAGNTVRYMGDIWADLSDDQWHTGGDEYSIREVVRSGVLGKMPANRKLTDAEIGEIVKWLYHLRGETALVDESGVVDPGYDDGSYDDNASSGDDAGDGEPE